MAVSWYSPSAVLTPGGVTAGLSDLAQVIASAPERQAQIQRQMEADARAQRDQALQEIQMGGTYVGPDQGLLGAAAQVAADRQAAREQRALHAKQIQAQIDEQRLARESNQALHDAQIQDLAAKRSIAQNAAVYEGKLPYNDPSIPLSGRMAAISSDFRGAGDRALKQREIEADIAYKSGLTAWNADRKAIEDAKINLTKQKTRLASLGKMYKDLVTQRGQAALNVTLNKNRPAELAVANAQVAALDEKIKQIDDELNGSETVASAGQPNPNAGLSQDKIAILQAHANGPDPIKAQKAKDALARLGVK